MLPEGCQPAIALEPLLQGLSEAAKPSKPQTGSSSEHKLLENVLTYTAAKEAVCLVTLCKEAVTVLVPCSCSKAL